MTLPKLTLGIDATEARHRELKDGVRPQGCNPFECGAKIVACATACASGVGTVACITCLGSAYDACKDCF